MSNDLPPREPSSLTVGQVDSSRAHRAIVTELSLATPLGQTRAMVITPEGDGPFPVVVYAHGTGADAEQFADDALIASRRGLAGIAVDLPYRPPFPGPLYSDDRDRAALSDAVVVLRSAIDLAERLPDLDATAVGYAGLSLGATVGVQLAALDKRVSAAVLISAVARIADYSSFLTQPATQALIRTGGLDDYLSAMREVDPVTYAPNTAPVSFLLQFGEDDWLVPRASADQLTEAMSGPAEARWYAGGHGLDDRAQEERLSWLAEQLARRRSQRAPD